MTIAVVQTLAEKEWHRFVEEHPQGNIFHTPEMFQVFARAKGHQPKLWAATDDNGRVLALSLPVEIALRDGILRRLTTRAVVYGSVLYDPSPAGEEALATLLRIYVEEADNEILFTELRNLSDLSIVQSVFNDCGFIYEDHLNYLIDLDRPVEEVMQGIGARTRKHIRRGLRKQEVIVKEITERDQIGICYNLLRKSYTRARVPLADWSLFEAAFDTLHTQNMVKFWLACVGEAYVATSVELLYKDTMYGWYGGVDRAYADYTPSELLTWHILKWGVENGYRLYDFGGAGRPSEPYGVRDFKSKFGGRLICYGRNTFVHTPRLLWLSKHIYHLLQRWLIWVNLKI